MKQQALIDQPYKIVLPCIKVEQPLGVFFVASVDCKVLIEITYSDIRKMTGEREIDTYLGIQREVDSKRVKEIEKYIATVDACFPTAVILAIPEQCAEFDSKLNTLTLRSVHGENDEPIINRINIAKVLDGQHRIEGLKAFRTGTFQVNVSIFIEMDLANQAYLFSTVNLAQTKVKKSLVYDLFEYSRSRSPQKSAHNIAVALDRLPTGPFYRRIKRLGSATPGRRGETLTQAAFVEAVMELMTTDAVVDRDLYQRGGRPARASGAELEKLIFRNLFIEEQDMKIADILLAYFTAAKEKWPVAWDNPDTGYMLTKTNGFRGLIRLLRPAYLHVARSIGDVPTSDTFAKLFSKSIVKDEDFVITEFLPGSGGEARLFRTLRDQMLPATGSTGLFR